MRPFAMLLSLGLLAACATPQEICINRATGELRTLNARISTTQANIERGYAVHRTREPVAVFSRCSRRDGRSYPCQSVRYITREAPVSISVAEERRKLLEMRERRDALQVQYGQLVEQCRLAHPE